MRSFSKLDTGVAPHEQRRINERLAGILAEVEKSPRAGETHIDYAPPAVRNREWNKEALADPASPAALSRVEQLCLLCRELTFGEMVEFAAGIKADPAVIHKWAIGYPEG